MTSRLNIAASLFALLSATLAVAADEPLPPEEAFQYVIADTGDALEIDFAIEDGYYLYRDELQFESATKSVEITATRKPEGEPFEDEWLGKKQVYREHFYVTVPYIVGGDRPETMELIVKSRGCQEDVLCYPPQTWVETVELKQERRAPIDLATVGTNAATSSSDFPPAEEVFFPTVFAVDGTTVDVAFQVEPGFYLYKSQMSVRSLTDTAMAGHVVWPKGKDKTDEFLGEQEVYYDEVSGRVSIARAEREAMDIEIEIGYQGCADGGLCYFPQTQTFTVSLPEATTVTDLSELRQTQKVSEHSRLADLIINSSIWMVVVTFFGLGLLLAFTPCVLPMVPILSGIIAGAGDNVSPRRGFSLAFVYVLGMSLVYTAIGVIAAYVGGSVQAELQQPWVLSAFAALFVLLAFAMFGAYDLQMPSSIQSKIANISSNQETGTTVGAFIMGALSAIVVTACVAPAIAAAALVIGDAGEEFRGGLALFAMSWGMGAPLLLVGAAQGRFLPKAGPWMVAVKGSFGFLFLGLAIWMLKAVVDGSISMALWATLVFMAGIFMGGLTTLTTESSVMQKLAKGFGLLAILYGLVLFLGALTGGTNPLKPLASVSFAGGGATSVAKEEHLEFKLVKSVDDLDREIEAAVANGKSVMLDFYADWCTACLEMEAYTFVDPGVQAALANTVPLQADVTKNDAVDQELLERFGVFAPPWIIFFDSQGQQRSGYEIVGFVPADEFRAHVEEAVGSADLLTATSN
ncbi:MAG: protein-disulfide reductase DsbD [Pseudomonadota bacterium]